MLYDQYFIDDLKERADLVRRLLFVTILFVALTIPGAGQGRSEAILVDEFGNLPCGDNLARLDRLYVELSNNPGSTGFVTIASSPEGRRDSASRIQMIEKYTRIRRFDLNRIKIVRSSTESETRIRFWRLPPGAPEPQVEIDQSYEIPPTIRKPFIFGAEELVYAYPECAENSVDIFGKFLNANPRSRANLVFRDASSSVARRASDIVVSELVEKHGIARDRIRVFIVKPKKPAGQEPITELWYLP